MDYSDITYEVSESIATITINRPERLNSFAAAPSRSCSTHSSARGQTAAVACVILTDAGQKAFCVGGDQKEMQAKGSYGTSANGLWEIDDLHCASATFPSRSLRQSTAFASAAATSCTSCATSRSPRSTRSSARPGPRRVVRRRMGYRVPCPHRRRETCPRDLVLLSAIQRAAGVGMGPGESRGAEGAPDG